MTSPREAWEARKRAWEEGAQASREVCMLQIRASCTVCEGEGFPVTEGVRMAHACGGDEKRCQTACPVPEQTQEQEECEYCGRPIAVLRDLPLPPFPEEPPKDL